jgi:glycosyltransferase involved in cell wall biosynthesis
MRTGPFLNSHQFRSNIRGTTMSDHTLGGFASMIIPCWNQLEFTRKCIAALMRRTRPPWELIVVNNGSTDGTGDYLAGVQDVSPVPVTIIANGTNRGFPTAINQGLQYARGEYLVLLNNDVVVSEGWLDQLIALVSISTERNGVPGDEESKIALAGPMSNYAAPPQLVENVSYRDLEEMKVFAERWREEHRGTWFTVPKLSGFCLLMKRAVYDTIGGLDERFGLGFFDDDDFAERARRAGFELAVAHDLFVHHFGSRTFVGNGVDAEKLLDENAAKFAVKWGSSVPSGRRVALKPFKTGALTPALSPRERESEVGDDLVGSSPAGRRCRAAADEGALTPALSRRERGSEVGDDLVGSSPAGRTCRAAADEGTSAQAHLARVSLTLIVRDEEKNLARCLESVRGLFDEIIVLDTGSRDRTIEIARSFGARVFDFVWVDDFAAARNAALARARGDYAFWLDADDLIEPGERAKLEKLLGRLNAGGTMPAFVVRCKCDPGPDGSGGDTVVDHIRLFPLIEGVHWIYRVHEQILPALKRAGVPLEWTDITVRHTGYSDRALRFRKLDRDSRILREELAERPDDPFTLFNLGSVAIEQTNWNESLVYLKRSLAGSAPTDSIVRKLYALIARSHQMLRDFPAALECCAEGLRLDPDDAELLFRKAVVHRGVGQAAEAEQCWRRILTLSRPRKFASLDQGIYGHLTRRNLAALAQERGDMAEARKHWQAVLADCPGDNEALARLNGSVPERRSS